MPRLAAALLASLCLVAAASAQTLTLGTWNLEHFGRRTSPPARTDADLAKMGRYIRDRRIDVLAVQEVNGAGAIGRLAAATGSSWAAVVGTSGTFRDDSGQIAVGFLFNTARVELVQAHELSELPRDVDGVPIFHRIPVSAVFRAREGGFDFRAITVHFKAGRGEKNEQKRSLEARHLVSWIDATLARPGEDRDVIVLGDFNHAIGAPAFESFTANGRFEYLRPAAATPSIIHFDAQIDQIAVMRAELDELVGSIRVDDSLRQQLGDEEYRRIYSDHIPVLAQLKAEDLDPRATFTPPRDGARLTAIQVGVSVPSPPAPDVRPQPADEVEVADANDDDTPFRVGDRVEVRYNVAGTVARALGQLTRPLGEWVMLKTDDGRHVAIPTENTFSVWRID